MAKTWSRNLRHRNVAEYKTIFNFAMKSVIMAIDNMDADSAAFYITVAKDIADKIIRINKIRYGKVAGMSVISR